MLIAAELKIRSRSRLNLFEGGKSQHAVIHHAHADGSAYAAENCPIFAAFSDGAFHRVDDEAFRRKDGTSFPVEYVSTPICHPEDGLRQDKTWPTPGDLRRAKQKGPGADPVIA